ncbi:MULTISPECIES: rubredoxin [unclassified Bradyrhizobium]|uniref:rubredoxin n=1 Tax=unclassified Bradyrhizobium TaxID=2631580 RepID=UPI0024798248|nr:MULTISPECIES: rubredoxin [unclassified Bradyrhizobium]WGR93615.1 rubredoxin [Bradyrhizobium sp. ISRA435]WGR98180.1 rubredoxin [Bradyrhizobium sp. ISRA436]WGS05069.1 rubredoxin [Bradyrhizobium sp. ISRA437]WGS11954.1 rubredoxin [Bradyrhizobium sp. ISRA443]WGS19417.1 rubredoxin [Bradyrhizobium sp. ISRA463]
MECGICRIVDDPAEDDGTAQIAIATPFAALSESWRGPNCDAPKSNSISIDDDH